MSLQYSIYDGGVQASSEVASERSRLLTAFVKPLIAHVHQSLDLRLVHTFVATCYVLLQWRHRNHGLLLSEMGGYRASPAPAPAGTKRLSNLLHSPKQTETVLLDQCQQAWERRVLHIAGSRICRQSLARRVFPAAAALHPALAQGLSSTGWRWAQTLTRPHQ